MNWRRIPALSSASAAALTMDLENVSRPSPSCTVKLAVVLLKIQVPRAKLVGGARAGGTIDVPSQGGSTCLDLLGSWHGPHLSHARSV